MKSGPPGKIAFKLVEFENLDYPVLELQKEIPLEWRPGRVEA